MCIELDEPAEQVLLEQLTPFSLLTMQNKLGI
jgi:hypothetical protein